ncbi:phenylacetate--CoA ligase family protein [Tuwongella immobilis]|uniref:AMP-dependent synthetase/ligase domain-containing protein n=1 Tax=Tuwongella immobilis TaxID=692036 RepID=A0A6C2YSI4_9BACT|nr:AMP-binding protein [Tuwongella immobilis]VIP04658.1 phenylacetate-- ligase : Coenzyme F390 synthetase (FtsA-2) OS=Pedosphaera parvula (strain Ellin514) GN=Cflav_PD1323 PE=4 SV=1: AMP-binding: AMP-binding_C_2 [Tuwongella immobilis]VTS06677.1 phenylacetate-- ligase : Coenzyme F390 synthetase (FtsA-2) OS=Pedosphaera parvula (strain Ellin514) GN=Cflav_PD1323 PE=4 SV=1: AMP-binding: AMP-binding_C_2 [Tuwongella immobilis]
MDNDATRWESLISAILPANRFYAAKLADWQPGQPIPFTTKAELIADQIAHPPYGSNHSAPRNQYTRLHQTSGTTSGKPLRWLDTPESWQWMLDCWTTIFSRCGVSAADRLFFPFSFGPFLGFWTAFEAATRAGWFCLPAGGMATTARLRYLLEHHATVICCTPTYALHLAEVAAKEGLPIRESAVRAIIVAGEPGGTIGATRQRIEQAWGARVFDHYGLTEVGPVAVESVAQPETLEVLSDAYIAEVINPQEDTPTPVGEVGELVLTNLGRLGSPLIRYRTGDLVRHQRTERGELRLAGGILGRTDDMIHIRGNNLYPGSLEAILRRFQEVAEYRVTLEQTGSLADLFIEIEPIPTIGDGSRLADRVQRMFRDELLFTPEIVCVPPGTLPRFEMKARRILHRSTPIDGVPRGDRIG